MQKYLFVLAHVPSSQGSSLRTAGMVAAEKGACRDDTADNLIIYAHQHLRDLLFACLFGSVCI